MSPFQLDLKKRKLTICSGKSIIPMHRGRQSSFDKDLRQVRAVGGCEVPPRTKAMVNVRARGMRLGQSYLYMPDHDEEGNHGSPN